MTDATVTDAPPAPSSGTAAPSTTRRGEYAVAFFGTWMMLGLFLDGWAHQANKPETFFSPWHGILYSGFIAAVAWFSWDGRKASRTTVVGLDRLATAGLILFVIGAVGDGAWHEIFGVEADIEALVSPSHLALFFGGFLMVTAPLRLAPRTYGGRATSWWAWLPQGVTLTLSTALIAFFSQYLSPFETAVGTVHAAAGRVRELEEVAGLASVLTFNALVVVATLYALRRWQPPVGAFTVLVGGVALLMTGLDGFDTVFLAVPAFVAGAVADALHSRHVSDRTVVAAMAGVLWGGYFAAAELVEGLTWTVELWAGAIVLAAASAALLASVIAAPAPASAANTATS